ncbi:MAG: radical SAM family heme chaperone HemW [Myxococcales bacterium]|nr:radical SAM family heme chaperone HemW [Myxococcales bacterium]
MVISAVDGRPRDRSADGIWPELVVAPLPAIAATIAPGEAGLYVHVPWCRTLCPYCDFAVHIKRGELPHRAYLEALLGEFDARRDALGAATLQTIYIGGGTPSLWDPACVAELLIHVGARCAVAPAAEVTLEVNPIDCTPQNLARWRAAGCNRLSIGVQALDEATLAFLGRGPHHGDGRAAVEAARATGFTNISIDFILGAGELPALQVAIESLAPLVTHMSVYELTIEAATQFGRRQAKGTLPMAPDEAIAHAYVAVDAQLTALGFAHYEVSSYARSGFESRHNGAYWTGRPYLGIGVGAASLLIARPPQGDPDIVARREVNLRSTPEYLRRRGLEVSHEVQQIQQLEMYRELIWLGLRTMRGVTHQALDQFIGLAEWLQQRGLVTSDGARWVPTLRGYLFANEVARKVLAAPVSTGSGAGRPDP